MNFFESIAQSTSPSSKIQIMTYGLSLEDLQFLNNHISTVVHSVYVADVVSDVIALSFEALLINSKSISEDDRNTLVECYTSLNGCYDESVFWIGYPKPPHFLRGRFYCYENLEELVCVLPQKLKKVHQQVKKSRNFSKNLADCLQILSLIRLKPGIKTVELSEKLELPIRTVQRHITTLQATGEWIEYDTKKRGWQLQYGISILFGDHLKK